MRQVGKMMALNVEKNYASEEQTSKLKRLYKLTPMKAIKGLLAITNPVKVGIIYLFLHSFLPPFFSTFSCPFILLPLFHYIYIAVSAIARSDKRFPGSPFGCQ